MFAVEKRVPYAAGAAREDDWFVGNFSHISLSGHFFGHDRCCKVLLEARRLGKTNRQAGRPGVQALKFDILL